MTKPVSLRTAHNVLALGLLVGCVDPLPSPPDDDSASHGKPPGGTGGTGGTQRPTTGTGGLPLPGQPTGGMAAGGRAGMGGAPPMPPPAPGCLAEALPQRPLLRLTDAGYGAILQDVFGEPPTNLAVVPGLAVRIGPQDEAATIPLGAVGVRLVWDNAARIATHPPITQQLADLPGCAKPRSSACGADLIATFVPRLLRRPVRTEDGALQTLWEGVAASTDNATASRVVLQALLQAPEFLYRIETGVDINAARITLTQFEIATRMSFLLWDSGPDAQLLAAAAGGELTSVEGRLSQAERMVQDPRSAATSQRFLNLWLGLYQVLSATKDPARFPAFSALIKQQMHDEAQTFARTALQTGADLINDLLTRAKPAGQSQRIGILGLPWFGAAYSGERHSNPVTRGLYVRERLLCDSIPPPPPNLDIRVDEDAGKTTRMRYSEAIRDPACQGCHQLFDSIGYAFENFDAIGAFRVSENGLPIDASGSLSGTDVDGSFAGQPDLMRLLANGQQVRGCMVQNYLRWTTKTTEPLSPCEVSTVTAELNARMGSFAALARASVGMPGFTQRRGPLPMAPPSPAFSVTTTPSTPKELDQAVVTYLIHAYQAMQGRLPTEEKQLLQVHHDNLRELERALSLR